MQKNGALAYFILGGVFIVLAILGIFVFQLNSVEERFITQSKQLRALGESTDRLAGRVDNLIAKIDSGGLTARAASSQSQSGAHSDAHADVVLRHPDVPNFLEEEALPWPVPGASYEGTLTRGWSSGDPKGFNPIIENASEISANIQHYVSAPLARRMAWSDPEKWAGQLAWRVEITDDYKEFTIYLRKGVKWHTPSGVDLSDPRFTWLDGAHEVTAHDVVFSLDIVMNPQVENGFMKSYYNDLESWEALDDHTVRIRWKRTLYGNLDTTLTMEPLPEFLWAYDQQGNRLPDETFGLRFNQHWYNNKGVVGNSAYRFAEYRSGSQIRLVRNEDWWGPRPAIRNLDYTIYMDSSKTLLLLKAHELGFASLRAGQYREEVLRWRDVPEAEWPGDNPFLNGDITCTEKTRPVYYYVGWNGNKPMLSDKRVRRALTMALDRQGIIDNVYVGLGTVATGPFLPSNPGNNPSVEALPFDVAASRALLAEAGWTDTNSDGLLDKDLTPGDADDTRTPLTFKFLISSGSPEAASMANIYKEDLLKVGIKMDIEKVDWSMMQKQIEEKAFDAYIAGWALSWTTDPHQLWHSSQADIPRGSNRVGFRNAEADQIIETLRETFDSKERTRLLRRFHAIVHDEQPYTFFRVLKSPICWWNDLENVIFAKTRPMGSAFPWSLRVTP
jgi:peptide/nickel transport system substrate-binding protein